MKLTPWLLMEPLAWAQRKALLRNASLYPGTGMENGNICRKGNKQNAWGVGWWTLATID